MQNSKLNTKKNRQLMLLVAICMAGLFLSFGEAQAVDYYVSPTGSGTESGDDWNNTLGWDALSEATAFIRGDTYFLADGDYESKTLDDAASGSTYIYIKKATASSHGTSTGWNSNYGDGVANIIAQLTISTDYWDINGAYGSLDDNFGIRVHRDNSDGKCIRISDGVDYLVLSFIEMENAGYSSASYNNADCLYAYCSSSGCGNVVFNRCWFHNSNRTTNWLYNTHDFVYDGCWFTENISMDAYGVHGEAFSINQSQDVGQSEIKNSVFRNIEGSAWVGFMNSFGDRSNYNWDIYNNLFYVDENHILDGYIGDGQVPSVADFTGSNSVVDILSSATAEDINVYGNSFANMQQNTIVTLSSGGTSNMVRNNLFVHTSRTGTFAGTITSNNQSTMNTSLMKEYSAFDMTLSGATNEGYTLPSPYNADHMVADRGADGFWDIGAYEFDSGAVQSARFDVDQSGSSNTTDAQLTLRYSLALDMSQTAWYNSATTGDADCSGTTNSTDAMLILRNSLGLDMSATAWCGD